MKNHETHWVEIYNRGKGYNFRLISKSNLGVSVIFSSRQGYEKLAECLKMIKKYCVADVEVIKINEYYRIKK
jgi:hypothetical protein